MLSQSRGHCRGDSLAEEESMDVTMIRAVHLESFSEQPRLLILRKDGRLIGLGRRRVIGSLT